MPGYRFQPYVITHKLPERAPGGPGARGPLRQRPRSSLNVSGVQPGGSRVDPGAPRSKCTTQELPERAIGRPGGSQVASNFRSHSAARLASNSAAAPLTQPLAQPVSHACACCCVLTHSLRRCLCGVQQGWLRRRGAAAGGIWAARWTAWMTPV